MTIFFMFPLKIMQKSIYNQRKFTISLMFPLVMSHFKAFLKDVFLMKDIKSFGFLVLQTFSLIDASLEKEELDDVMENISQCRELLSQFSDKIVSTGHYRSVLKKKENRYKDLLRRIHKNKAD